MVYPIISDRLKVSKELLEVAKIEKDKYLAHLEMVWIKLLRKENLQKCIEKCEKILESCQKQCPEIICLAQFWLAFSLWTKARQDLQHQHQESVSRFLQAIFLRSK